jgi:hypothetical protein
MSLEGQNVCRNISAIDLRDATSVPRIVQHDSSGRFPRQCDLVLRCLDEFQHLYDRHDNDRDQSESKQYAAPDDHLKPENFAEHKTEWLIRLTVLVNVQNPHQSSPDNELRDASPTSRRRSGSSQAIPDPLRKDTLNNEPPSPVRNL